MAIANSKIIGNRYREFAAALVEFRKELDAVTADALAEKVAATSTTVAGKITGSKFTSANITALTTLVAKVDAAMPAADVAKITEAL